MTALHRAVLALCLLPAAAPAQDLTEPPVYLRILRTAGLPDLGLFHAYGNAGVEIAVLGATSVSGPQEAWLMELHDSFGSIEDVDQKLNIDTDARILIGLYLPGLSYRPDQAIRTLPKARYLNITVYRILPGADATFGDLLRARRGAFDSINLDRPEMAYRIISGAASGTYVLVAPMVSLRTMDNGLGRNPAFADAMTEAGTTNRKLAADSLISRESTLLRVQPRLSRGLEGARAPAPQ